MWPPPRIVELGLLLLIGILMPIKNELRLCDAAHVGLWSAEPRREENSDKISFNSIDTREEDQGGSSHVRQGGDGELQILGPPDLWPSNEVNVDDKGEGNEDVDMASSERHARQLGGGGPPYLPPRPTIFEQAGRAVNNLAGNVANGIAQQHGNVNRTLGNLDRGVEQGSNRVRNLVTTTYDRRSKRLQGVVARITNFFHTGLGALGRIVNFLGNGFRQLILSIFNRHDGPLPPPPGPPPPPPPHGPVLIAHQEEGHHESVAKTDHVGPPPGGHLPAI